MAMTDNQPGRLGAKYEVIGPLPAARADRPLLLRVRVLNTGAAPWPNRGARAINLSYHWLDARGQVVDFEGLRGILPDSLRPGAAVELTIQVEPPPKAGSYLLALDLVEEGIGWFSQQGVAPLTTALEVTPGPADAPRVCIVNGNCVANDALGNHVLNQLRFFQACGYRALALVEHADGRIPIEQRQHLATLTLDELREGPSTAQTRRAVAHFRGADLFVFNYSAYYALAEAIRLVSRGIVMFDYHGVTPQQLWNAPGAEALVEGQRRLDLARYADYAIAHSDFTRQELIATGAVDSRRVYQMAYAVPLDRFRPGSRPPDLAARYGLTADQPVLLYVGRMADNKRIPDLVRGLTYVRARMPGAALLLVGDDRTTPYTQTVAQARELAGRLGVADGVIFAGQVPDEELAAHYRLADVFVTASLHEGFCIPAVEAMACGIPVVGAHATALPETIGPAGMTFRPEDPADLAEKVLQILESRSDERQAQHEELRIQN
jgi:glycosyltransferase involved in cell wall biosynthesis